MIIYEQRRDFVHIVAQLMISDGHVGFLTGRGLQLNHDQRQTIDEQDNIGSLLGVLDYRPLIGDNEFIIIRLTIIDKINESRPLLAVHEISDRNAVLQIIGKGHILLKQAAGIEALELTQSLADRFIGQGFIDAPQG